MIIQDVQIAGDLILRVPVEKRFPVGWDRLTWAWRALRGEPYERPHGMVITHCIVGASIIEAWGLVTPKEAS